MKLSEHLEAVVARLTYRIKRVKELEVYMGELSANLYIYSDFWNNTGRGNVALEEERKRCRDLLQELLEELQ